MTVIRMPGHYTVSRQAATVSQEIIVCNVFLFRKDKFTLTLDLEIRISPAVPHDGQIVLRDAVIICAARQFFHQFFLFRQEFQLLLFVDTDQEFLHILFVALISGQDPVTVIEMGIVPLEQPQKFRIIEQPHSFLPVALRQVGKMEQIPDITDSWLIQHQRRYMTRH